MPVEYNPAVPPETFDVVIVDECHRSIYGLWRQVLDYFDAFTIGLTATPAKQTFGFFNQNLVMEYGHEQAVADGVNVDFDVYRIRTEITEQGSTIDAGHRHRVPRPPDPRAALGEARRGPRPTPPSQLDRAVVARDQIRTVLETFRDRLFTEIFPGRSEVPKTLIFAKDDATPTRSSRSPARCSARATTSPPRSPTRRPARRPTSCSPRSATATTRGSRSPST